MKVTKKSKIEYDKYSIWAIGPDNCKLQDVPEKWNALHDEFKIDAIDQIRESVRKMKELYLKLHPDVKPEWIYYYYE